MTNKTLHSFLTALHSKPVATPPVPVDVRPLSPTKTSAADFHVGDGADFLLVQGGHICLHVVLRASFSVTFVSDPAHQVSDADRPTVHLVSDADRPTVHLVSDADRPTVHLVSDVDRPTVNLVSDADRPTVHLVSDADRPTVHLVSDVDRPTVHLVSDADRPTVNLVSDVDRPTVHLVSDADRPTVHLLCRCSSLMVQKWEQPTSVWRMYEQMAL